MASSEPVLPVPDLDPGTAPASGDAVRRHVQRAQAQVLSARRRVAASRVLAGLILLLLLLLVFLDASLGLAGGARRWLLPGVVGLIGLSLVALLAASRWLRPSTAQAIRLLETASGDRERQLTAALELDAMPGELAAEAVRRIGLTLPTALPAGLPRGRPRAVLLAIGAALGLALLAHLALPGLMTIEWWRFSDPYGDHPPFSLTRLEWTSLSPRARPQSLVTCEVELSGRLPSLVTLLAGPGDGMALRRLPMYRSGSTRWTADLVMGEEPVQVWAEAGGTRSRYGWISPDPIPVLAQLDVRLESPAYAGLAADARRLKPGLLASFASLPGSRLVLAPSANRSLQALRLRCAGVESRVPLVQGQGVVLEPAAGTYQVAAEAEDGALGAWQPWLSISARVDQPPTAQVIEPSHDCLATPGMRIPFAALVEDDLGLVRMDRVREAGGIGAPVLTEPIAGRTASWTTTIDLPDLGVVPGDILRLGVVATDSKPGGGQASPFADRTITIISDQDYNRMLLRRLPDTALLDKYRGLIGQLAALSREAIALKHAAPSDATVPGRMQRLLAQALSAAVQALKRDHPLWSIEPALQAQILAAAQAIAEAAAHDDQQALPADQPAAMLEQDLTTMIAMAEAQGLLGRLREIIDAQQNTAERLVPLSLHAHLADADRVRLRELAAQEGEIATALDTWATQESAIATRLLGRSASAQTDDAESTLLASAAGELDDLAHAVAATQATELIRQAAAAARAGDGDSAHGLAKSAAERLLALLQRTESEDASIGDRMCLSLSWCDGGGCRGTLGDLARAAARGYGLGGAGSSGLGLALGYGGDDDGSTDPSSAQELLGPESFAAASGAQAASAGDGLSGMAQRGDNRSRSAPAYQTQVRAGTAGWRPSLVGGEQRLVGDYFKLLEDPK